MKRIYEYELEIKDKQVLKLPMYAEILTVNTQNEKPMLWALVDVDTDKTKEITIEIFETGQDVRDRERGYIGTVFIANKSLVLHVFEEF